MYRRMIKSHPGSLVTKVSVIDVMPGSVLRSMRGCQEVEWSLSLDCRNPAILLDQNPRRLLWSENDLIGKPFRTQKFSDKAFTSWKVKTVWIFSTILQTMNLSQLP